MYWKCRLVVILLSLMLKMVFDYTKFKEFFEMCNFLILFKNIDWKYNSVKIKALIYVAKN